MENNSNQKEKATNELPQNFSERDWFLQVLVQMTNDMSGSSFIGVTLLTHGFLVSGRLVNGQEYFKQFADEMKQIFKEPNSDSVHALYEQIKGIGTQIYHKTVPSENMSSPSYIHLVDAKFFHTNGNPIPGNRTVLWRGRISAISGFNLGLLEVPEQIQ